MTATLPRASRFVLEILPFVLSALIGLFIVSGYLHSRAHAWESPVKPAASLQFGLHTAPPVAVAHAGAASPQTSV